jgi:hypothetical protein
LNERIKWNSSGAFSFRGHNDCASPLNVYTDKPLYLCLHNLYLACIDNVMYGGVTLWRITVFSMMAMSQVWNCYKRMNVSVELQVGLHLSKNFWEIQQDYTHLL